MSRPTEYLPEYCEKVIELGKLGKSITQIACELNVVKQTVYDWEKAHPEFLDALGKSRQFCQKWWEDMGQDGLTADKFRDGLWAKQVSCRFPSDYRETKDVNLGGQKDNPIQTELKQEDRDILNHYIKTKGSDNA